MCQQVTSGDSTLRTDSSWEDGRQTLQRVLDRQAEKTRLEVYHLLHDSSKSVKEKFDDATLLEDNDLWNRFAVSNSKQEGGKVDRNGVEGWGVTAKRAGKSVQHMVKHLPEDSE